MSLHIPKLIKFLVSVLVISLFSENGFSQNESFNIAIEPIIVTDLGGLQSFVVGQSNGKWLIIGGRLDGLHRRQPWAAFDVTGNNTQLIVVDPVNLQKWTAPLASLPVSVQEQLSSTNMEFHQQGDMLYIIGGYGYSNTAADHITYPNLTAVNVTSVIDAIVNGTSFTSYFRQITDEQLAVTGGYLQAIYDTYYLVGGHRFDGRYNPMGGPTFTQTYTNAIRKFTISDDGVNLAVNYLSVDTDATNLHRRDYNLVPQIMPNGEEGLTAFSGVFQVNADLPYLNCVNIDSSGYSVNNAFSQYYNHYHCANVPVYSAVDNEMHTIFFGGMAQYYDSLGTLVQDNNVPFVKTIARVTRDANGTMAEYKLPLDMPGYLGSGSEFIPVMTIPQYANGVIKLDSLSADSTLIGYVYGGINSSAPNIFFINDGTQSTASSQIFEVYLIKNNLIGVHELNPQSTGTLQMQVSPNPNNGAFEIQFNIQQQTNAEISVYDSVGKLVERRNLKNLPTGANTADIKIDQLIQGGVYFITIETVAETVTQKVIVKP